MRCVWVLLGVQTHIFTLHPYLRVLLMDFKNQLHENDFSFGAEKHFFSPHILTEKSVFGWKSWLKEAGKPAFPALFSLNGGRLLSDSE